MNQRNISSLDMILTEALCHILLVCITNDIMYTPTNLTALIQLNTLEMMYLGYKPSISATGVQCLVTFAVSEYRCQNLYIQPGTVWHGATCNYPFP